MTDKIKPVRIVSVEKMSKKAKRAYYASQRGSWNGVNPVSRVVPDKTKYDRARASREALRA